MGKENKTLQIQENNEVELRTAENEKFWEECGVNSLLEKLRDEALNRYGESEDVICDLLPGKETESLSLVINWYNTGGEYSSVAVARLGNKKVHFMSRENGELKDRLDFDMSKLEERDGMKKKINSIFFKYLISPVKD